MARPLTPNFMREAQRLQGAGYGPHFIQVTDELAAGFRRRDDWALDYVDNVWAALPEGSGDLELITETGEHLGYWSG